MRMRTVAVVGLLAGMACAAGADAAKGPMTFEDLMAMRRASDPQVSVSGRRVLFSLTDVSLERNPMADGRSK